VELLQRPSAKEGEVRRLLQRPWVQEESTHSSGAPLMSIGLCASPHVFSSPSPEVMSAPASAYCLAEVRNYHQRRKVHNIHFDDVSDGWN
jgi:hypothetical protein